MNIVLPRYLYVCEEFVKQRLVRIPNFVISNARSKISCALAPAPARTTCVSAYSRGEFIVHRDNTSPFPSPSPFFLSFPRSVYELILLDFYDITYPHLARARSL